MNRILLIIFIIIVSSELIVIAKVSTDTYSDYSISKSYSVTEIDSNTTYKPENSRYEYFYDIKPNSNSINGSTPVPTGLNESGFRDRYDYKINADKDVIRIITLGDSHTYGIAVPVQNIFPEILEDLLNNNPICVGKKYEVINLGMHGYDLLFAEERFRLRGTIYNPDLIIWFVRQGDLQDHKGLEEEMIYGKNFDNEEDYIEAVISIRREIYNEYGYDALLNMQLNSLIELTNYFKNPVFVFSGTKYIKKISYNKLNNLSLSISNLHVFQPFDLLSDELIFENDAHPNTEGHAFIAQKLYDYFSNNSQLLCRY